MSSAARSLKLILVRFFGAVLVGFLFSSVSVAGPLPAFDLWKWPQVLDYYNTQTAAAASGCVIWLETYSTASYRMWKRCGVAATVSGKSSEEIVFPGWSGTLPGATSQSIRYPAGSTYCNFGTSSVVPQACFTAASGGSAIVAGFNFTPVTGVTSVSGDASGSGQEIYHKFLPSCSGVALTGSSGPGPFSAPVGYHYGAGSTKFRRVTTGTLAAACLSADVLVKDFGNVTASCTTAGVTIERNFLGRVTRLGSCGCIPLNSGIDEYVPPDSCTFRGVVFDPTFTGSDTGLPGTGESGIAGHSFTNADLAGLPSDLNGIPVIGAGGGVPYSSGFGGSSGSVGSGSGSGSGFTGEGSGTGSGSTGGGSGGAAPGTGSGNCAGGAVNCNDDGTEDAGSIPSPSSFDGTVSGIPTEGNWVQSITDFLAGSPIVSALSGSAVTVSSSTCTLNGTAIGKAFALDFCPWASTLAGVGSLLVVLSNLAAFWIIWRT